MSSSTSTDSQSTNHTNPTLEVLDILKQEYGASNPKIAEHLNSLGLRHYHGHNDTFAALQCHQEALKILDWNKCDALLFDRIEESQQYAVDMAVTLSDIGNVLREMNDFVGSAGAYRKCLDLFLEGLIEGGGSLKMKLGEINEFEAKEYEFSKTMSYPNNNSDSSDEEGQHQHQHPHHQPLTYEEQEAIALEGVNREEIGPILARHPGYRSAVRGISHLLREMQYVKFIAQNAASSRRRRRMHQNAAAVTNIQKAIASLNFSNLDFMDNQTQQVIDSGRRMSGLALDDSHDDGASSSAAAIVDQDKRSVVSRNSSRMSGQHERAQSGKIHTEASFFTQTPVDLPAVIQLTRSKSWASMHSTQEEVGRPCQQHSMDSGMPIPRPIPMNRRAITSEEDYDRHVALSLMIPHVEHVLRCALNRFPGVNSIISPPQNFKPMGNSMSFKGDGLVPHLLDDILVDDLEDDDEEEAVEEKNHDNEQDDETTPVSPVATKEVSLNNTKSPRSISQNVYHHADFLRYSIGCGGLGEIGNLSNHRLH